MTLSSVSDKLRKRVTEYRWHKRFDTKVSQAMIFIEMALNLTEMALVTQRPISVDEEQWFHEGWPVINSLADTEWEDIIDLYRTMTFKLEERNWMRQK